MPKGFVNLYVVAAIAFAAVLAYAGYQYQRAEASSARAAQAEGRAALYKHAAEMAETENDALKRYAKELDVAIVERDKRARALAEAKRKIESELNALKESLPAEDQACLNRSLPPALAQRLLDP